MDYPTVRASVRATGLRVRGAFHPHPGDGVPAPRGGVPAATLVLLGNAGAAMWEAFRGSRWAQFPDDPLDGWSREVIEALGARLGARPLFPFEGPPYLPFQRWAQRADTVWMSPVGLLIHPDYGLWHAYRGALAFAERLELPAREARARPCDTCPEQPCLTTCPADALGLGSFELARCVDWLDDPAGADCVELGCRARRACPVGREYIYPPAQAQLHMRAFRRSARRRRGGGA